MTKKSLIFFIVFVLFLVPAVPVKGYNVPSKIRVGLESRFKELDQIIINNKYIFIGSEINGQFMPFADIQMSGGFSVQPGYSVYVRAPGLFASYNQAYQMAAAYGVNFVPAVNENAQWMLYGTGYTTEAAAANTAASIGGDLLPASATRGVLLGNGQPSVIFEKNMQIMDANGGMVSLSGYNYRGAVEFGRYTGNKITAVNVLTVDEYLYSVVPSEMPASFQLEALKAQAVAARSYTLTRMGVHTDRGYDLCDLSHCQNYAGASKEADAAIRAVNETQGRTACYDGQPINAVYFSSSGGVTDNSENVWVNAVSYLKSVNEINEYEPKVWTRAFSLNEINSLLVANNINIGSASGVAITRVSANGRVQELTIYGASGNKVLTKEEIRTFFSSSAGGSLESRNFTLANGTVSYNGTTVTVTNGNQTQTFALNGLYGISESGTVSALNQVSAYNGASTVVYNDSTAVVASGASGVVFNGRGWGHGVGMSQRGAEGMAQLGYDYITILKHYYTGIVIE